MGLEEGLAQISNWLPVLGLIIAMCVIIGIVLSFFYLGREVTMEDTQVKSKIKDEIARKIRNGGLCISFGWNSSGLGKNRGFEIIEIMLIAHGGGHNDTICTVERKWQKKEGKQ